MRVIYKEPGKAPEWREIEDTLRTFQRLVGGYIETVTMGPGIVVVCNDEGRIRNLEPNCVVVTQYVGPVTFVGNIAIVGITEDGEEFSSFEGTVDETDDHSRIYAFAGRKR